MTFLQQPALFASEPSSALVVFGLLISLTAIVGIVTLVVAFALASSREKKPASTCKSQAQRPQQAHACGGAVLS